MKHKPHLHCLAFVCAMAAAAGTAKAAHSIVPVAGTYVYTQTFDTMFTPATSGAVATTAAAGNNWQDGVTVPDWFFHYATNAIATPAGVFAGASFVHSGNDGSAAPVLTLNSMGAAGSTDRAFASPSTTNRSEQSGIVVFQNTSTKPVLVSGISYNGEVRRTNSGASNTESIHVSYRTGASQSALLTMTSENLTSAAAAAKFGPLESIPTAGNYVTGWNSIPSATWSYGSFSAAAPVDETYPIAATGLAGVRVEAGQFIALRFSNVNAAGTDALMGIDDLQVTFEEVNIAVSPLVNNLLRNTQGTPLNPSDDTVDFDLTVSGIGAVNPAGWQITSPPSLTVVTGVYNTPQRISMPITEFAAGTHTLDITVIDAGNPGTNATVTVTAPWCSISAVASNISRDSGGNSDPLDDTWGYTATITGQFTGSGWNSDNAAIVSGSYSTAVAVTGIPIFTTSQTTNFFDAADASCTASLTVSPPRIIGSTNFGVIQPLYSDNAGIPGAWVVDESLQTQNMANGGGVPARVYRSEVIDLSSLGEVLFTGALSVVDLTSGFEVADSFNAQLIIDGNTAAPVSLITPYDTATADGVLTGAEISPATVGPPPVSGAGNFLHLLTAVIPASANSVQLVISGNNDSANEIMTVQNLLFQLAPHSIQAQATGGPVFNNNGTIDPADDTYTQAVNILAVSAPVGSTGWVSNVTPAAGLYADANPVVFGPFSQTAPPPVITLADNNVPLVTTSVALNSPVPDLVSSIVEGSMQRQDNGTPDNAADDTVTVQFNVSAPVGGPSLVVNTHPSSAVVAPSTLTAAPQVVTVTLSNVPEHGALFLTLTDASYPVSTDRYTITMPPVTVSQYVVARKDFGSGLTNVVTSAGVPLPVEWSNLPSVPALQMNNGGALAAVASEVIDLSTVGEVTFSANLRITDISTGFEESDTFKAELIVDGNAAAPVNLITPFDTNLDGVLSGLELTSLSNGIYNFPLNAIIDAAANSVQLVVTAINNSASEFTLFENALFQGAGVPPIVPGSGSLAVNVGASGKLRASALATLASGGGGALTVSAVQAGPTARGGSVSLQEGRVIYESPAGYSGVDTFTYTITDGTQSVTGTVTVVIGPPASETQNLIGMVPAGDGVQVGGMGIPGRTYVWQHSSDLSVWTALGASAVCPANGVMGVLDPGPLPPTRFYRLVEMGSTP